MRHLILFTFLASALLAQTISGGVTLHGPMTVWGAAFVAWGDSLTLGGEENDGVTYPNALSADLGGVLVSNQGIGSYTSAQITPVMLAATGFYGFHAIFWEGFNDYFSSTISQIVTQLNLQIAALTSPKYLVLSITNRAAAFEFKGQPDYNTIISGNQTLASTYPNNYLDVRSLLVANYNQTNPEDVFDQGNDVIPSTMRAHFLGGSLVGNIAGSDTAFSVVGVSGSGGTTAVSTSAVIAVDSELILVNTIGTISGSGPWTWQLTSVTRGYINTTATSHTAGTAITVIDPIHLSAAGYRFVAGQIAAWYTAHGF